MRLSRKAALNVATGLATAVCLHPEQALAGPDPFALPDAQVDPFKDFEREPDIVSDIRVPDLPDYAIYAEVTINGKLLGRLAKLTQSADGTLNIAVESAVQAGLLKLPMGSTGYIPLRDIAGITHDFDNVGYRLDIRKRRKSDGPNAIDMGNRSHQKAAGGENSAVTPITIFALDYDVTASASRGAVRAAGLVRTRIARDNIHAESAWRLRTDTDARTRGIVRLDTSVTLNRPGSMTQWTAGDFVTASPSGTRAVRMGGLQWATDFGLRPDLITYPLPDYVGDVSVPTEIDLLINDRRLARQEVEEGEFTIRNIPVPAGRSNIDVVVLDALGRESLQTLSFYGSRRLLAPGLAQHAVNVGTIRRNYGFRSNDYGRFAMSGMLRRGLTRNLTGGAQIELSKKFFHAGLEGIFSIGSLGLASAGVHLSQNDNPIIGRRSGQKFTAAFESYGPIVSLRMEAEHVTDGFDDLASANGDRPPQSLLLANLSFRLEDLGTLNFSAVQRTQQQSVGADEDGRRVRIVSASYRKSISRGANLFVDLSRRSSDERKSTSILFGISMLLGGKTHAQANYTSQPGGEQITANLIRGDATPGDVGYAVQATTGVFDRLAGSLSYRGYWGRAEAQAETVDGRKAARISARGSLVLAGGDVFAVEQDLQSMVLVDAAGVEGVKVERHNRLVGKTSRSGKLLITGISPLIPVKISIDPKSLPPDVLATRLKDNLTVSPRSAVLFDLGVSRYVPRMFELRDHDGKHFPPGTTLLALPSGTEYLVGFDGAVEINDTVNDKELRIKRPDRSICYATLASATNRSASDPGVVVCDGWSRQLPLAEMLDPGSEHRGSPNLAGSAK